MEKYGLVIILILSLVGFIMMKIDKRKAVRGRQRISEASLLTIACLGGSLGVFLGMYSFRHKTKKLKFKFGIPLIIIIQTAIFFYIKTN